MKDLLLRTRVVDRTSNMKISRCRLADYVKTLHQKVCGTCSTIIFLHSTNQIIDLWRCRWHCRRQILTYLMTTTTITPQINDLIGWMKKNNVLHVRQAFWCIFFDVVCQTTTWNFHFSGFWRQRNPAVVKFLFFAFACQASESVFRLFCWPWPT